MADLLDRARAFSFGRQRLGRAAPDVATALASVVGVYSSHPSAPLSLHARARAFDAAAFRALEVVRLPAMRGSIHLLPLATGHVAFRALPEPAARAARRLGYFGVTEQRYIELAALIEAEAQVPRSARELRVATGLGEELQGVIGGMTREGRIVRVGAEGLRSNELRYRAATIGDADPDESLAWLVGAYLRAFGPARVADVVWWTGATIGRVRRGLAQHDLAEVGDGLVLHTDDVADLERAPAPRGVDLVPKWDCWMMGYAPDGRQRFADPSILPDLYDHRGDGRPVVLADGRAIGTWDLVRDGREVALDLPDPPGPALRSAIDARVGEVLAALA